MMNNKKRYAALVAAAVLTAILIQTNLPSDTPSPTPTNTPAPTPTLTLGPPRKEAEPMAWLPLVVAPVTAPHVVNLGFEGDGWYKAQRYLWPSTIPTAGVWQEIQPGQGWVAWWIEGRPCPNTDEWVSGRPEVKVIDLNTGFPDHLRVSEGSKALQWFTFYRCGIGGVYQQVKLPAGTWRVGAKIHAWYTSCSDDHHSNYVKNINCEVVTSEHMWLRLGADPAGRADFYSDSLAWGPRAERYGTYAEGHVWSDWFRVGSEPVTLWLMGESTLPFKHNDIYVDDVVLERR